MASPVQTTCAYCGVGCGVVMHPTDKGGFVAKGDESHPANFGRLCSKGSALGDTLELDGRLLHPMIGERVAPWDTALDLIADKFTQAIAEHGPDSVAFYVSGQLLTEDYYVANKLMKGYIGSANIDTNSRLCMASSVAGHKRAFGEDIVPNTYEDLEEADLVVMVGSNLAWCHPVLHQRVMAGGAKTVTIDPRRTMTAESSDMHLPLAPGSDVILWRGLMGYLKEHGHYDSGFAQHLSGLDAAAPAPSIAEVAEASGMSVNQVAEFYALWASTPKVVTIYSQGVNQATDGTDKVNAILDCHLATGRIGRPGSGPFSVTGQPNAMGGREVGGLANMLAAHLDIENADHRTAVQDFWQSPAIAQKPGLRAVDMFRACASGQIKALWVMHTNPAVSLPEADAVRDAIANVPFVVVSDIEDRTDTTVLADVRLPALAWGEKSGTVTNSERRISRQRPFLPAPGAAKPDWWHMAEVGKRMGWEDAFNWQTEAEIFDEYARMTALSTQFGKRLDVTALADVDYETLAPVMWPVGGPERLLNDGQFPAGKGKILAPEPKEQPRPRFRLNTGRIRDHWHTMTRTSRSSKLSLHIAEPFVEVHPNDAKALGVTPAGLVRLSTKHGEMIARALVTDRGRPGELFAPIHWTAQTASAGRVDALVPGATDPISGQPASKSAAVEIEALKPAWFGFAVSVAKPAPEALYWARARTTKGWQVELAGTEPPEDWVEAARSLFGADTAQPIVVEDRTRGIVRVAFVEEGRLIGALFTAPDPVALSRGHVRNLLGEGNAAHALAGRPDAGLPDPGPTVCACFGVGLNTILDAISGGAVTVDAVGAALKAGTNCGACRPEIAALLPEQSIAAE
ncbi:MAG: molybdopterin-dependent oxidoreductase [Pseudomonadota bacterium]